MPTTPANPKVDAYLARAKVFGPEMEKLREIVRGFDLVEELKWGKPCYTLGGANVVIIVGFTKYCALLLPKGALLKDPHGILVRPTEETQAARQIRFTEVGQIAKQQAAIKAILKEAIAAEKAGLKVPLKDIAERAVPEEFQARLNQMPNLKEAFEALTPGRRRQYLMHFAQPKQAKTREARVEKCIPAILEGLGLND